MKMHLYLCLAMLAGLAVAGPTAPGIYKDDGTVSQIQLPASDVDQDIVEVIELVVGLNKQQRYKLQAVLQMVEDQQEEGVTDQKLLQMLKQGELEDDFEQKLKAEMEELGLDMDDMATLMTLDDDELDTLMKLKEGDVPDLDDINKYQAIVNNGEDLQNLYGSEGLSDEDILTLSYMMDLDAENKLEASDSAKLAELREAGITEETVEDLMKARLQAELQAEAKPQLFMKKPAAVSGQPAGEVERSGRTKRSGFASFLKRIARFVAPKAAAGAAAVAAAPLLAPVAAPLLAPLAIGAAAIPLKLKLKKKKKLLGLLGLLGLKKKKQEEEEIVHVEYHVPKKTYGTKKHHHTTYKPVKHHQVSGYGNHAAAPKAEHFFPSAKHGKH